MYICNSFKNSVGYSYYTTGQQGWRTYCTWKDFFGTQHFFCPTSVCILWRTCVYIHISDCEETVCELPLLPNNTASETFLHKPGVLRSVDWIFIIGVPAWRWLGNYMTLDKTFYKLPFKQEVIAALVISKCPSLSHCSRRSLL